MLPRFKSFQFAAIFTLILIFTASLNAGNNNKNFEAKPWIKSKDGQIISSQAKAYLANKKTETVKVWVFFTDKDVFTQAQFDKAASKVKLSDKVLKRRAKVKSDFVAFIDLPVATKYVSQLEKMGGTHRRSSKWLNAASFEMSLPMIDRIEKLPFVSSIRPVAGFQTHIENDIIEGDSEIRLSPQAPDALNYGFAQTQLDQINVPAAHNQGLTGAGVTLAIMDTGFRKSHEAFAQHYTDGRVLAEYDFVFNDGNTANEIIDDGSQWNHGTLIWGTSGGLIDGKLYGPAYGANFILCKTEDIRSETAVEEDNWIAALEFSDTLGADVITTSLGYSDWYTQADYDGNTAPITLAANTCDGLGIVMCNSAGNSGPGATTISPPADAFDILTIGAVNSTGFIASFSSRGPTYDGRIKPEVCAQGVSTYTSTSSADNTYGTASGTSLSTPLVAGATCLMIEAHPDYTPEMIREALKLTASNAATPDNDYGWGVIDLTEALNWGVNVTSDVVIGDAPLTVNFNGNSNLSPTSWSWTFGDGATSTQQNPTHIYTEAGVYNVGLSIETSYGTVTSNYFAYAMVFADTMYFVGDSAFAGDEVVLSVNVKNTQPLNRVIVPFHYFDYPQLKFDSASRGLRTEYFESLAATVYDPQNSKYTFRLIADNGGGAELLPAGDGEVMKLHFSLDSLLLGGLDFAVDSANDPNTPQFVSSYAVYEPQFEAGSVKTINVMRGDFDVNFQIDITDLLAIVDYMFIIGSPAPPSFQIIDIDANLQGDIEDLLYLVDYMFNFGPPPVSP